MTPERSRHRTEHFEAAPGSPALGGFLRRVRWGSLPTRTVDSRAEFSRLRQRHGVGRQIILRTEGYNRLVKQVKRGRIRFHCTRKHRAATQTSC
jgi:hypothetical protein